MKLPSRRSRRCASRGENFLELAKLSFPPSSLLWRAGPCARVRTTSISCSRQYASVCRESCATRDPGSLLHSRISHPGRPTRHRSLAQTLGKIFRAQEPCRSEMIWIRSASFRLRRRSTLGMFPHHARCHTRSRWRPHAVRAWLTSCYKWNRSGTRADSHGRALELQGTLYDQQRAHE